MTPVEYELVASNYPHLKLPRAFHMLHPRFRSRLESTSQEQLIAGRTAVLLATDGKPEDYINVGAGDNINKRMFLEI